MLSKTFLRGLAVILPGALTAYVLFWLGSVAESTLGGALRFLLPEALYLPGMGIVAGLLLVFALGLRGMRSGAAGRAAGVRSDSAR